MRGSSLERMKESFPWVGNGKHASNRCAWRGGGNIFHSVRVTLAFASLPIIDKLALPWVSGGGLGCYQFNNNQVCPRNTFALMVQSSGPRRAITTLVNQFLLTFLLCV